MHAHEVAGEVVLAREAVHTWEVVDFLPGWSLEEKNTLHAAEEV